MSRRKPTTHSKYPQNGNMRRHSLDSNSSDVSFIHNYDFSIPLQLSQLNSPVVDANALNGISNLHYGGEDDAKVQNDVKLFLERHQNLMSPLNSTAPTNNLKEMETVKKIR
jgi:hypothetical protein